ncbi:MAG: hypothetical protein R2834_02920 [Rhodothermales bacterium]
MKSIKHTPSAPIVRRLNEKPLLKFFGPGYEGCIHERRVTEHPDHVIVEDQRSMMVEANMYRELEPLKVRLPGDADNVHRIAGPGYEGIAHEWTKHVVYDGSRVAFCENRTIRYQRSLYEQLTAAGSWLFDRYEERAAPYSAAGMAPASPALAAAASNS